jgi:chorismate synthase
MRWLTAGESHGPALTGIIEGIPAGVLLTTIDIQSELGRRRLGFGRGARQKFEEDQVTIKSGVRHGITQGGPITIEIANSEWPKWEKVMAADPVDPSELQGLARNEPLSRPRPGHADLVGMQKYGFTDARPILERASARETAMRVALSVVARQLLREVASTEIFSHVIAIGKIDSGERASPSYKDRALIDESPVRAAWSDLSAAMVTEIEEAHREGDTLGGVFEVVVENCPIGLGSHVHWDRRIDSRLAAAIMGIQAIKGVEIGDGFASAARRGSAAHDEIEKKDGSITRLSNHSGGTEGGMTTGERLRVRGAMKPISTVPKALATIDVTTGESAKAINQRSDVCAVPAAGVIGEAMVALVLTEALLEKFGGDHIEETKRNFRSFMENISVR